jgi:cytochrome c556
MRTIALLCLLLAGPAIAEAPTFETVGSVRQIMIAIITPASNVVFKAPGDVPTDAKSWAVVQNNALMLAESGNLLMIPGRAKDNGDWAKDSKALVDAGAAAYAAANAKNIDSLTVVGDQILDTCKTCHQKYNSK